MTKTRALLFLGTPVLICQLMYGQTDSGRISGMLTDSTGAIVPNATVTVTNDNTGVERKASSNAAGIYFVGQLTPAPWSISAVAPGLASSTMKGVTVQVGQERTINLAL